MKINSTPLKQWREEANLSQTDIAEKLNISQQKVSKIEKGYKDVTIWEFASIAQVVGQPTENFWMLYLDTDEYEAYRKYRELNLLLRSNSRLDEARKFLPYFEKTKLAKEPFIKQFIAYAHVVTNEDLTAEQAIIDLEKIIKMTMKDYNETEVINKRMTYHEILIVTEIAFKLYDLKEYDRSIELIKAILKGRENAKTTEDDRRILFPSLTYTLAGFLRKAGRIEEALSTSFEALKLEKKYSTYGNTPWLHYNIACCQRILKEEVYVYKSHLEQAYYCARAHGDNESAAIIKKDAEENFGILIQ
ncbi:MAG: helix-turn-helix domain-containing protein [Defluviitaleaceae bacterium]|nr:helix-turn-helix domain-containing protein [Defluviitaleaceae bacterium]